jgi:hypothetical protein
MPSHLPFVEREAGDDQRLALRAGLLDPIVAAPFGIDAVADLRHHAFEAELAGMREHLATLELEALAELDVRAGDDLLQFGLAADERFLPDVSAGPIVTAPGEYVDGLVGQVDLETTGWLRDW